MDERKKELEEFRKGVEKSLEDIRKKVLKILEEDQEKHKRTFIRGPENYKVVFNEIPGNYRDNPFWKNGTGPRDFKESLNKVPEDHKDDLFTETKGGNILRNRWEKMNTENQEYPKTYLKNSDGPEFIYKLQTIAQSQHVCTECERIINPGEEYEMVVGKWGEELCSITTCYSCLDIRERFFPNHWTYSKLFEELRESLQFYSQEKEIRPCLEFLTARAKSDVLKLFGKVHGIGPRRPEEDKNG